MHLLQRMSIMQSKNDFSSSEREQKQRRKSFTHDEDMAILYYVLEDDRFLQSSGNKIWKLAEEQGICPGRGFWSLKERYRKVIVRNIYKYPIDRELASRLEKFSTANAKGKAKMRHTFHLNSRLMYPDIELVEEDPSVLCSREHGKSKVMKAEVHGSSGDES